MAAKFQVAIGLGFEVVLPDFCVLLFRSPLPSLLAPSPQLMSLETVAGVSGGIGGKKRADDGGSSESRPRSTRGVSAQV